MNALYDFAPEPDDEAQLPLFDLNLRGRDDAFGRDLNAPASGDWAWHDARLIGLDRGEDAADARFEIGAIDLYTNLKTGDLGGSYLPIASFSHDAPAVAYYQALEQQMDEHGLAPHQLPGFAEERAVEMATDTQDVGWRGATADEYTVYGALTDATSYDRWLADEPPDEALDPLLQTALELGGVIEPGIDSQIERTQLDSSLDVHAALKAIGVQVEEFDPTTNPPPFYDEPSQTAYWVGVFQADEADRDNCITSVLSFGPDPETGQMAAQLAPCLPGDWERTQAAADHLIQVAQRGGIEPLFDAAEAMALASQQRELWSAERGVPLVVERDVNPEIDL